LIQARRPKRPLEEDEDLRRMLYLMINEAARCLEEGVVDDPGAIDIAMIMGTGFPAYRGGLLRYADSIGVDKVVHELGRLRDKFQSPRFEPCPYLLNLKNKNETFYSHRQ